MTDVAKTRALWLELHEFAKKVKVRHDQLSFIAVWLRDTHDALDCGSCWNKLVWFCKKWPIAYGEEFYLWSICLHDYVNKEMGRPLFYPELTLAPLTARDIIQ